MKQTGKKNHEEKKKKKNLGMLRKYQDVGRVHV
jgi:hypothetical protein